MSSKGFQESPLPLNSPHLRLTFPFPLLTHPSLQPLETFKSKRGCLGQRLGQEASPEKTMVYTMTSQFRPFQLQSGEPGRKLLGVYVLRPGSASARRCFTTKIPKNWGALNMPPWLQGHLFLFMKARNNLFFSS